MQDKNITIFTLSLFNNNWLRRPVVSLCISGWNRLKEYIENTYNVKCNIKIYTPQDPEVIEFYKILDSHNIDYTGNHKARIANIFRFWIMSRYKYHMWLDGDIFVSEKPNLGFKPNEKLFDIDDYILPHIWCCMYNADKLEPFKLIYDKYMDRTLTDDSGKFLMDQYCMTKLNINTSFVNPLQRYELSGKGLIHLNKLEKATFKFKDLQDINYPIYEWYFKPIDAESDKRHIQRWCLNVSGNPSLEKFLKEGYEKERLNDGI